MKDRQVPPRYWVAKASALRLKISPLVGAIATVVAVPLGFLHMDKRPGPVDTKHVGDLPAGDSGQDHDDSGGSEPGTSRGSNN